MIWQLIRQYLLFQQIKQFTKDQKKKRLTIYDLDKLIFPNDPIRDYIEAEIAKTEEKHRARLERLEAFKF